MKLDLIIPYLLQPPATAVSPSCCQILEMLLSRSQMAAADASYESALFTLFNLSANTSVAELTALADDIKIERQLFRADPVFFQAQTDHALLLDAQSLNITRHEADALAAAFNAHFIHDGLRLEVAAPDRWYLQVESALMLATTSLQHAIGRNARHFLPSGNDALRWRKILNETQMLFYAHSVNQQRENNQQRGINGLWLWGEGVEPEAKIQQSIAVYADDVLAQGVAKLSAATSQSVAEWFRQPTHGVLVLNDLVVASRYADEALWQQSMDELCGQKIPAIQQALRQNLITELHIYSCDGRRFECHKNDLYKLWRWRKSMSYWMQHEH